MVTPLDNQATLIEAQMPDAAVRAQTALPGQPFHQWSLPDGSAWTLFYRTEAGYLLRFPGLADFMISTSGSTIACWRTPETTPHTVEHLYLNQVLPLAMSRRYELVLHASAVEIDAGAVAFLGDSGRGKSTLAASFATGGSRFLTDDGLQLQPHADGYRVKPSHPSIRLWEDSQAALVPTQTAVAPSIDYTPKARLLAGPEVAYCDALRPLRAIYFLGEGTAATISITGVGPRDALMRLVKNCFLLDIEEHAMLKHHFSRLAELARAPLFFELDYPRDYALLPAVRARITAHVRSGT
jgi:hypothetical protein